VIPLPRDAAKFRAKLLLRLGQGHVRRPTADDDQGVISAYALNFATLEYEAVEAEIRAAVLEEVAALFELLDHPLTGIDVATTCRGLAAARSSAPRDELATQR
jgi:hypothetical protein